MKFISISILAIILLSCGTIKNPRYNIKSNYIEPKFDSEFEETQYTNDNFMHFSNEDIELSQDDMNSEDSAEDLDVSNVELFNIKNQENPNSNYLKKTHNPLEHKKVNEGKKKKSQIKTRKANSNQDNGARTALIIAGVIVTILSLVVIWYASILFGAILLLGGLAMWIIGGVMPKSENQRTKSNRYKTETQYNEMVDVVYLKNGGVRRGIIIEQIPGKSLKIKTNDGSVYVFKMDEIEKITKE